MIRLTNDYARLPARGVDSHRRRAIAFWIFRLATYFIIACATISFSTSA